MPFSIGGRQGAYNQETRPIWAETTLGEDQLMLNKFDGTEMDSVPFEFRLQLVAQDPGRLFLFASC